MANKGGKSYRSRVRLQKTASIYFQPHFPFLHSHWIRLVNLSYLLTFFSWERSTIPAGLVEPENRIFSTGPPETLVLGWKLFVETTNSLWCTIWQKFESLAKIISLASIQNFGQNKRFFFARNRHFRKKSFTSKFCKKEFIEKIDTLAKNPTFGEKFEIFQKIRMFEKIENQILKKITEFLKKLKLWQKLNFCQKIEILTRRRFFGPLRTNWSFRLKKAYKTTS